MVKITDYLDILSRRKWLIIFTMVITLAAVALRTSMMTPTYTASATLRVLTASIGSVDFLQYDLTYTDRLMNTYAQIAQSTPVLEQLLARLDRTTLPNIAVSIVPQTELMQVTVEDTEPGNAKLAADTLASLLIEHINLSSLQGAASATDILQEQLNEAQRVLEQSRTEYETLLAQYPEDDPQVISANRAVGLREQIYATLLDQYERTRSSEILRGSSLSIIESASLPIVPSSPNWSLNLALGSIIGLAAGLALAFFIDTLDSTLYSSKKIERVLPLQILGKIPEVVRRKQVSMAAGNMTQSEAFRNLRTNLLKLESEIPLRTLAVTSALPNEGKSTTVANLAVSFGQMGYRVVVVDCDLQNPSQDRIFDCAPNPGLVNIIQQSTDLSLALQTKDNPNVHILPCGRLPFDIRETEMFSSGRMSLLLEELGEMFDIVLLDLPALRAAADAVVLAPMADGILVVAGRKIVSAEDLQSSYQQLFQVKTRVLGIVINRAERQPRYGSYARQPSRALFTR